MPYDKLIFTQHALDQLIVRYLTEVDIGQVLEEGTMVEEYPDDLPYPGYLVLGYVNKYPLHVIAADNDFDKITYVRTMYQPDRTRWDSTFTKRRKQ